MLTPIGSYPFFFKAPKYTYLLYIYKNTYFLIYENM